MTEETQLKSRDALVLEAKMRSKVFRSAPPPKPKEPNRAASERFWEVVAELNDTLKDQHRERRKMRKAK